jgi:hypothetical protein
MRGAAQVVILGAGFDSRAYRFRQALKQVKVFGVDFGPTQEYKRRRVIDVLGPPPMNVTDVPVDFSRGKLSTADVRPYIVRQDGTSVGDVPFPPPSRGFPSSPAASGRAFSDLWLRGGKGSSNRGSWGVQPRVDASRLAVCLARGRSSC